MPAPLFFFFPERVHSSVPKMTSRLYFVERSIGTQRFVALWPLQANRPTKEQIHTSYLCSTAVDPLQLCYTT